MFGYIRVSKGELKIKEYEMYKAVYCSLCKKLGKDYGIFTRFALNYDFTFTALLTLSLSDNCCAVNQKKCVFNPFKKCNYCKDDKPFALSAAALIILSYYKIIDDIDDEKGFKKLGAKILKGIFSSAYKKAGNSYPEIDSIVKEYIKEQRNAEKDTKACIDSVAEPSSKMLSLLLPMCAENQKDKTVLGYLGRLIGRYIYLLDCGCDLKKDIKNGSFNPLSSLSEEEAKERVKAQLYIVISEAEKAFELLNIKRFKGILGNIIYVGLEDTMNLELFCNKKEHKKKREWRKTYE